MNDIFLGLDFPLRRTGAFNLCHGLGVCTLTRRRKRYRSLKSLATTVMDPFSITASALGLLSSVTSLSFKLNELRQDFTEAETDIDDLNRELAALSTVLEQLRGKTIMLPSHNSSAALARVLEECNRVLLKAEAHLRKESRRSFRRAHWAVSGRREHMSICRGIESYKLTLTMTIILATVPQYV